jgi:osmotically-inducible protein OsmY
MRVLSAVLGFFLLIGLIACNPSDQERAREQARKDGHEIARGAEKASDEIKKDAEELSRQVDAKVQPQLDHAAMLSKVKTKLATDAGLDTLANVNVDVNGSVVTLSGTVTNEYQKKAAGVAASKVDGVTQVDNHLTVQ